MPSSTSLSLILIGVLTSLIKIQTLSTKLLIRLKFYFEFMMYKSRWKLNFIQIFAQNVFLVFEFLSFCMTWHLHDGQKSFKKVTYFREFAVEKVLF